MDLSKKNNKFLDVKYIGSLEGEYYVEESPRLRLVSSFLKGLDG